MSKAQAGMKLVRWLPQIAEATADDIAQFGSQSARVRALLDFLPTMSDDAARISEAANDATWQATDEAMRYEAKSSAAKRAALDATKAAQLAALDAADYAARDSAWSAARNASWGEVVNNLISPTDYRTLTNPLATGRAFDIVQRRGAPENFLDVVRGLGDRSLVTQPIDVLGARALARATKSEREALMEVINAIAGDTGYADTGYGSLAELIEAARLLG